MTAYYNEIDPFAADWLEKLIDAGQIAWGVVDRRSIEDILPSDLAGFTQVHFFAGIGVWSYALRQAGWADDRPVWTGSCPCQPFSAAGKGNGFADERHIWPAMHWLVEQCRPSVIFGEQVSSKDGLAWLDLVQTDMEATGYAFGALDLCAAGVGAPHIRQRSYWMAHRNRERLAFGSAYPNERRIIWDERDSPSGCGVSGGLADLSSGGQPGARRSGSAQKQRIAQCGLPSGLADNQFEQRSLAPRSSDAAGEWREKSTEIAGFCGDSGTGPTNGQWGYADWLPCRDGKWRPVESGTFPLVNGSTHRVGRLRGYGNALVAPLAQEFIETAMEWL